MDADQYFELTERFERLVAELNSQWMVYNEIFGVTDNFEVLNQSGPLAWLEIRDALIDSILLGIGRLLDPAQMRGRDNLSIDFILSSASTSVSGATAGKIALLKNAYQSAAKTWRNRTIGHNDHRTAMGLETLPELPSATIGDLMQKVNETCSDMSLDLKGCRVEFAPRFRKRSWTPRLLSVLQAGVAANPIGPDTGQDEEGDLDLPDGND